MDGRNFDGLARSMGRATNRRGALAAALGAGLAGIAALGGRAGAWAGQSTCQGEGEGCGLTVGCCGDLVCVRLPLNPNAGACRPRSGAAANPTATATSGILPPNTGAGATATAAPTTPPVATLPPTPTATPEPTKRDEIIVTAECRDSVDTVRIRNVGETAITIQSIRGEPGRAERIDRRLGAGSEVTFSFGGPVSRDPNRLSRQPLFDAGQGNVEVLTSLGIVRDLCED